MQYQEPIEKAARAGGQILSKYFGQGLETTQKGIIADFRTKADTESEEAIIAVLKKYFPDYNIHAEEEGYLNNKSEFTFIIDPLDGTNNFVLGFPYFSVAIALTHKETIVAAAVFNPILDQFYYAEKGKGAYLNNNRISVGKETDITKSTISYICQYVNSREYWKKLDEGLSAFPVKRKISFWSPALDFCLMASGRIESIIANVTDEIFDVIPGKLIAKEAGAVITDEKGNTEKMIPMAYLS